MSASNEQFLKLLYEESEEISNKIKRLEQLASQIEQSNRNHLEQLKKADIRVDNSGVKQKH